MKKFVFCVLSVCVLVAAAPVWADTITLTIANTPGATPADNFRVEEQTSTGTWGNITGATGVTVIPASATQYATTVAALTKHTYRLVPIKAGVDGTPSNSSTCGTAKPTDNVSITCVATPN